MLNITTINSPTFTFTPDTITLSGVDVEDSLIILITSTLCLWIALLLLLDIVDTISKHFDIKAPKSDDNIQGLIVLTYIGLVVMVVCDAGSGGAGGCDVLYSCYEQVLVLGVAYGVAGLGGAVVAVQEYYREREEGLVEEEGMEGLH